MGSFSQTELDVAKILRSLPKLIRRSQTHRRVNCCNVDWGVKKRRSDVASASASSHRKHCNLPLSPSAPLLSTPVPESTAVVVQIPKVSVLSPASPLLFYPSDGEETDTKPTVASSSSVSPNFRPSKKAKVRNKEWIKEQNDNLSALYELNKNLRKEAEETRNLYQSLFAENTRLKQIKSKWEMEQKRKSQEEERQQQKEEEVVFLPQGKHVISPTPAIPTTAKVQQESTALTTTQSQHDVPIAPPQHHQLQYNHYHHQIRLSSSSRSLTLSSRNIGSHGGLEIPDLNARVDENGFVLTDPPKQSFQPPPPPLKQQQVVVMVEQRHWIGQPDPKKSATAEARKKRIEINRRKASIVSAAGSATFRGGNRVGLAVER